MANTTAITMDQFDSQKIKMSNLGDGISLSKIGRWTFSESTPDVFDSHVQKSVPLYLEGHQIICDILPHFIKSSSLIIDVGCSTGVLTKKVSEVINTLGENNKIIGVDPVNKMCKIAKDRLKNNKNASIDCSNIEEYSTENIDLTLFYYTLQFIRPDLRLSVLKNIYESTKPGGGIIIFEKTYCNTGLHQDLFSCSYDQFKINKGYNLEERIQSKRMSLRGVLEPYTSSQNIDLIKNSGFSNPVILLKYLMFEGYLAFKY